MVVIPGLSQLLEAVGKHVASWDNSGSRLVVDAGSVVQSAVCPRCTCSSSRPHGRYRRWVADCPSFGQPVTLSIEVWRFKCVNPGCTRRTFTERIETLVAAGQRRTLRLVEAVRSLGYALGGQAAARLAARLGMRISGPTVLRDLRRSWISATGDGSRRHWHRRLGAGARASLRHDRCRLGQAPSD